MSLVTRRTEGNLVLDVPSGYIHVEDKILLVNRLNDQLLERKRLLVSEYAVDSATTSLMVALMKQCEHEIAEQLDPTDADQSRP